MHDVEKLRDVNDNLDAKVDELAQANMQLYEMNRLKSDFLATMSHEIRTPMNGIIGMTELTLTTLLTSQQKSYLNIVRQSADSHLDGGSGQRQNPAAHQRTVR